MKTLLQIAAMALFLALGLGAGKLYQAYVASDGMSIEESDVDLDSVGLAGESRPIMISLSTCPACRAARKWLASERVDYLELAIDQSVEADRIARQLGVESVPVFLIDGRQITGFSPDRLQTLLAGRPTPAIN